MKKRRIENLTPEFYNYLHELEDAAGSIVKYRKKSKELIKLRLLANIQRPANGGRKGGSRNSYPIDLSIIEEIRGKKTQKIFSQDLGFSEQWYKDVTRKKTMGKKGIEAIEKFYGIDRNEFLK